MTLGSFPGSWFLFWPLLRPLLTLLRPVPLLDSITIQGKLAGSLGKIGGLNFAQWKFSQINIQKKLLKTAKFTNFPVEISHFPAENSLHWPKIPLCLLKLESVFDQSLLHAGGKSQKMVTLQRIKAHFFFMTLQEALQLLFNTRFYNAKRKLYIGDSHRNNCFLLLLLCYSCCHFHVSVCV